MESMVERVAKALCEDTLSRWRSPLGVQDEPWREFIPAARAAIGAMREPSSAMCTEGGAAIDALPDDDVHDGFSIAAAAFHAMIDAALDEQVSA